MSYPAKPNCCRPIIRLSEAETEIADRVGKRRQEIAVAKNRSSRNVNIGDESASLAANIRGARAEVAAKVFLNPVVWHALTDGKIEGLPDLGDFIDVKSMAKPHHSLLVQADNNSDFAYFLVDVSAPPLYVMIGWMWGHEAKQPDFWDETLVVPSYRIKGDLLPRKPLSLFLEVRRRQGDE